MGIPIVENKRYSKEEYLAILAESQEKYEYVDGALRMMAGASIEHNRIKDDLTIALGSRKGECRFHGSDTAVSIRNRNRYYFPDLTFVCGKKDQFEEGGIARLLNPSLIIEVISSSTESIDRGEKFHDYCQLESFREYILIDSRKLRINAFYRQEDTIWQMQHLFMPEHVLQINTLDTTISLKEIYAGIELEEE